MKLEVAVRKQQKLRMALYGGAGKTYSSLLLAYGLCGEWNRIVLIDTEDSSGALYAHLGPFHTIQLAKPFSPSKYYEALDLAEDCGAEVIIVDSLSHEWRGEGGVTDPLNESDQKELLQDHRCLLSMLTSCKAHLICTMHARQHLTRPDGYSEGCYALLEAPVQEEGILHRFTTVVRLDEGHRAYVVKDRTGVFEGMLPIMPEVAHGALLRQWCTIGEPLIPKALQERINACTTVRELHLLIAQEDLEDMQLITAFTRRRLELERGEQDQEPPRLSIA